MSSQSLPALRTILGCRVIRLEVRDRAFCSDKSVGYWLRLLRSAHLSVRAGSMALPILAKSVAL